MINNVLESILERETPVVIRTVYGMLPEVDQERIDKKVQRLTVTYILIPNSNTKQLCKHLKDQYSIGSNVYP